MRTLVDIPDDDLAIINKVVKAQSISRAEFITTRDCAEPDRAPQNTNRESSEAAFGLLAGRSVDGMEYQVMIRKEWE
ncbi:MAG: CopG family transcriptional regulator [Terracidiphilus sp.]|jgi:hypothetical protein